ncbi:MAG TPA: M67 family metallopeptidase [Nitrosopumilus sp.]|nr:M67 family metallopeptidase [Nitrosopumilus sp.]
MQKIILTKLQKKILLDHSHKEEPNESCAILYGDKNGEENIVKEIWLVKNIDSSPVEFTLSFDQTSEMYKKEKELNLNIIGIFHSHPNSEAHPSNTDEKYMKVNQDMYVWIIYSGINKNWKAFKLESEIAIEEKS